ncbi:MarR family transcriptional regulator [Streptomyces microflavus]|uniref:MarR family transcriptional regulator n=1 Tax=Streptomyces TaxID=1883 RepID=UPI00167D68EA|nr:MULTISPECIES: MarR family transcriptional regulator [Streptomyces]MDX2981314.1 MarR family transcriptional regulator [Streptomyces sp. NRRL_B-2249]
MAKPGYGKRSAPDQRPRTPHDFSLLPVRERYVAGFVDHLPEGAAMSVKQLAKQLPLYGQQAISSALTALSVAGHLRRVRCAVGAGDETRWVFRTFWSRTAHDNEWWNTHLTAENTTQADSSAPDAPAPDIAPPPPWVPDEEPPPPVSEEPGTQQGPEPTPVPHQRTPDQAPDTQPVPPAPAPHPSEAGPSPAYLALARLGHEDHRLPLSADDCQELEAQAAEWLARGVSVDYLITALTAGLPAQVDTPLGFVRRRLTLKMPPHLPTTPSAPSDTPAPPHRILMECTDCGRPGQPEALPDGLCRPCRTTHRPDTDDAPIHPTEAADIKARMTNLRGLLKSV